MPLEPAAHGSVVEMIAHLKTEILNAIQTPQV